MKYIRISCPNCDCKKNYLGKIYEGEKKTRFFKCNRCKTTFYFPPKDPKKGIEVEMWNGREVFVSAPMIMTASVTIDKTELAVVK